MPKPAGLPTPNELIVALRSGPFMRTKVFIFFLLLFGMALAQSPPAQSAAPEGGTYRVTVRVEVVDAQVINKKTGHAADGLKREDFQVYEDNVLQEVTAFSQDELPLSVVILFDLTDSVRPVLKSLSDGALEALQHLKPEDEVAVMAYAASVQLIQDSTTDRALAAAAISKASRMESREAAFFNEGIYQAAALLGRSNDSARRRVIIWLTDNVPNIPSEEIRMRYGRSIAEGSLHTEKDAMLELLTTGTTVCTLLKRSEISDAQDSRFDSNKMLGRMMYPPGEVNKYAEATGCQVLESSGKKLKTRLAELIDDLRMRYSLSYHPSLPKPKGKFCKIKVKLAPEIKKAQKDLIVEAKQGYYR
jgi:VWFA-related protein